MRWRAFSIVLFRTFALMLWALGGLAYAGEYRPVIAVLSFQGPKDLQKDLQLIRQEIYTLLEADDRLQVFSSQTFESKAKEYGYTVQDLFEGDGLDVVARDTEYDGVLVGKVQKLGAKFELTLRVYDGGTGLGLLTQTFTLPRMQLRQGEKEVISSEVATALSESRLSLDGPDPIVAKATKKELKELSRKEKRQREKAEAAALAAKEAEEKKAAKKAEPKPKPEEDPEEISQGLPPERPKEEPKKVKKPKPEKEPKEIKTDEEPTEDASFGKFAISAGPSLLGRFSAIQAVDANGAPLANFEPTQYAAPAYGGASARITIAPIELLAPTNKEPFLLLEGSFSRSFGLSSNLDGQAINTAAQELSAAASLRVDLGGPMLALKGHFTQYNFAFVLNAEQQALDLQTQLQTLGLVNLGYKILGFGPELQIPLGSDARLLFIGSDFQSIFNAGQEAQDGYGLVDTSFGAQARLGSRFRMKENLLIESSVFGRFWAVNYEGGGTLLEGETIETRDKLFGVLLSAGYTTK